MSHSITARNTTTEPVKNTGMAAPREKYNTPDVGEVTKSLFQATYHLGDMGQMIRESHAVDIAGALLYGNVPVLYQVNATLAHEVAYAHQQMMNSHAGYIDLNCQSSVAHAVDMATLAGFIS